MEIGGLVADTFRILLGNPDVMTLILTFTIFLTLLLVSIDIYQNSKL
ncbi:hypothetical protein [Anaerobacillus arseniciselenatis]|nr:hypothetical protein [Anaerobacillus arseniciselenatis]